ncbi:MAG: DUF4136 domain-containing protein [Polaribacter sp.]
MENVKRKNSIRNLKFVFLVFLMSCSSSKVITDYDIETDFSKFTTFEFYEDNGDSLNELDVKRITSAIQQQLEIVGFEKEIEPHFFIYFDAKTSEKQNNNTIGIGIGGGGRNGGIGISGGIPIGSKKLNEEINIKFIEATSNELFWEGSLISTIKTKRTPKERTLYLQEVIKKIISKYPPNK